MALNVKLLSEWETVESVYSFTKDDAILYALGVGLPTDPVDAKQLRFVYEEDFFVLPTMATVMGARFPWLRDPRTGINLRKMLHGESRLTLHRPLPSEGTVLGHVAIEGVVDRGPEKGAAVYFRHEVRDSDGSGVYASVRGCFIMRDGGGCGSTDFTAPLPHRIPDRTPDESIDFKTSPRAGLIYRLTGDHNPLHASPSAAAAAGFDRPILHGSCTYGIAGYQLLAVLCDYQPARVGRLDVRFTAPIYPGETVRTEVWNEGGGKHAFRCVAVERNVVVLGNGYFEMRG